MRGCVLDTGNGMTRRGFVGAAGGLAAASAIGLGGCSSETEPPSTAAVKELERLLTRKVITPAKPDEYNAARTIWNAWPDRKPEIIAPCHNAQDVANCVTFAGKYKLPLSIRSGAHHVAGYAMNTGGLVIDLSAMRDIKIDAPAKTVTVGPVVRVGELAAATESKGLLVPGAAAPTVAFGGMTTGGGEGWFGEFGLTLDNLLSAEVVTADGRILRVDKDSEPDLFWAIRGGSGNFGVVTSLTLQAHPVPPLMFGMMAYPLPLAKDVGMKWRDHALAAAPDFSSGCAFVRSPMPGMTVLTKTGRPLPAAKAEFDKLRSYGRPVQEMVKPMTLTELQMVGAIGTEAGYRYYSLSHYLKELTPELFDLCIATIGKAASNESNILLQSRPETLGDVAVDATAYPHRGPRFSLMPQARWRDPKDDAKNIAWVKDFWSAALPFATGLSYTNFVAEADAGMAARAYGPNLARLSRIKRRYDPDNLFNSAVNILPA